MSKKSNDSSDNRKRRIVIEIIILIIIILLLITSCTVNNYFGKIGQYDKATSTKVKKNTNDMEINRNDKLYFDIKYDKYLKLTLKDKKYKVSYSVKGIKPKKYSCSTSNSKIATCRVRNGYIEIIPKRTGKVKITLTSKVNGIKYIATLDVKIVRASSKTSSINNNYNGSTKSNSKKRSRSSGTNSSNNATTNNSSTTNNNGSKVESKSDARLKSLRIGNYDLIPAFNKDIYEYMINVPNNTSKVVISATPNSKSSKIISGTGSINLGGDTTTVKITVRAKDGTEKDYIVKVNKIPENGRLSNDNKLRLLTVNGYDLTPEFDKMVNNYLIDVPYNVTKLDLSYLTNDEKAIVNVSGNSNFKVGNNQVVVRVTAQNGKTNDYIINVNRLNKVEDDNSKLKELTISGHNIDFNEDTYTYSINVDKDTTSLDIIAIPKLSTSDIDIVGNRDFKGGSNIVSIIVTAKNGSTSTYNIVVNKEFNTTNTLSNLAVRGYSFDRAFDEDINEYNVTVPWDVDNVDVIYTKKADTETVEIIGNENLVIGNNIVEVNVTSENEVTNTYKINVLRQENLGDYYIRSFKDFSVGYNNTNTSKDIIIDSNVLDEIKDVDIQNGKLRLNDGNSYIELTSSKLNFELIKKEDNQYVIRVNYDGNSIGNNNITVTAKRKGRLVDQYDISFVVNRMYSVTLSANGGFYNEFADKYELTFYAGERLNLSDYSESYKLKEGCISYKVDSYNTKSDGSGTRYELNYTITVNDNINLFVIYKENPEETEVYKSKSRLYLTDVDIFKLENGTKNFIYPGTEGSYVMTIKNTTDAKITLKELIIEEDNICISQTNCLNMGYIVKHTDDTMSGYKYLLGSSSEYSIINSGSGTQNANGTYRNEKRVNLDNIELASGKEKEISLLWKWVDSSNDTEIGNFVNDSNNTYYLTVSYVFEKENTNCQE